MTKGLGRWKSPDLGSGGPGPRPLFAVNWLGYFGHITFPPWASISPASTEWLELSEF